LSTADDDSGDDEPFVGVFSNARPGSPSTPRVGPAAAPVVVAAPSLVAPSVSGPTTIRVTIPAMASLGATTENPNDEAFLAETIESPTRPCSNIETTICWVAETTNNKNNGERTPIVQLIGRVFTNDPCSTTPSSLYSHSSTGPIKLGSVEFVYPTGPGFRACSTKANGD
jgi:hypothetical protein